MARHLAQAGLVPERVIVSTALRTQQTFMLVQEALGVAAADKHDEGRIYEASLMSLMEVIRETPPDVASLMLVGHNPGMAELALILSDPGRSDREALGRLTAKFPTAAVAVIAFEQDDWRVVPRRGKLTAFITPRQLGGVDED